MPIPNEAPQTTTPVNTYVAPKAPTITPREIKPEETVESRLTNLLETDSPYIEIARQGAKETAAERGLLSTSIAAGAGERAAIEAGLPIAQQDAGTFATAGQSAQEAGQTGTLEGFRGEISSELAEQRAREVSDLSTQQAGERITQTELEGEISGELSAQAATQAITQSIQDASEAIQKANVDQNLKLELEGYLNTFAGNQEDKGNFASLATGILQKHEEQYAQIQSTPDVDMSPEAKRSAIEKLNAGTKAQMEAISSIYSVPITFDLGLQDYYGITEDVATDFEESNPNITDISQFQDVINRYDNFEEFQEFYRGTDPYNSPAYAEFKRNQGASASLRNEVAPPDEEVRALYDILMFAALNPNNEEAQATAQNTPGIIYLPGTTQPGTDAPVWQQWSGGATIQTPSPTGTNVNTTVGTADTTPIFQNPGAPGAPTVTGGTTTTQPAAPIVGGTDQTVVDTTQPAAPTVAPSQFIAPAPGTPERSPANPISIESLGTINTGIMTDKNAMEDMLRYISGRWDFLQRKGATYRRRYGYDQEYAALQAKRGELVNAINNMAL
jgi:hypothetical protein